MHLMIAILGAALFGLAACGSVRPTTYYQFTTPPSRTTSIDSNAYPIELRVGRFYAPHWHHGDRIGVYTGPGQLSKNEVHRWAEPPAAMLESNLRRLLRVSGRYQTVESLRGNAGGDYIVRGRLDNLKEINSGERIVARVEFAIELCEIETHAAVWSKYYSHDEPVNGKDVSAFVAAVDQSAERGLEEAVAGIERYFAAHPPKRAKQ